MFSRSSFFAVGAALMFGAVATFSPTVAQAKVLTDCGNIDLSGNESCTFETSGTCTADCTPVSVEASCSANLEATCSGGCTAMVDATCNTDCTANCSTSCTADPGSFSCSDSCEADCSGNCSAQCSTDMDQTQCMASCQETCGAHCDASCTGTAPSATCDTQCAASCTGSCTAQANFNCDISCQESGSASCTSMVQGGCTTDCGNAEGALFCNGQFVNVDTSDLTQLQACLTQLSDELGIDLSITATGTSVCDGGTCSASGKASASCGQIAPGAPVTGSVFAVGLGLGIAGAVRRRVRKSKKA
jgi:hypothetical protein